MSGARVTEAHRQKALYLLMELDTRKSIEQAAWLKAAIAQALADAEQAEREALIEEIDILQELAAQFFSSVETVGMVLRARGTPAKEKADG